MSATETINSPLVALIESVRGRVHAQRRKLEQLGAANQRAFAGEHGQGRRQHAPAEGQSKRQGRHAVDHSFDHQNPRDAVEAVVHRPENGERRRAK